MSPIGLRVGPFEIVEEAHVPAHGSWYRARRAANARREPSSVMIRLLGPSPTSRELAEVQAQFEALRAIDDPRIPSAVALYEGSGALAVRAPSAAPLARVVQARLLNDVEMTPATLVDLALEFTEAVQAAHQRGQIHGHLSADNVALSADGNVWVWGFGAPDTRPPFPWLPPERARGDRATAATDQWSLGALIVALVSGQTPWSASSASADPRSGELGDFVESVAAQWPALGRLCRRMLDPDPDLRFPSLHPVRLELLALGRRAGGVSDRRELAVWLQRQWALEHGTAEAAEADRATFGPEVGPIPVEVQLDDEPALGVEIALSDAPTGDPTPARVAASTSLPPVTRAAPSPGPTVRAAAATLVAPPPAPVDDAPTEMAEDWIPTEMAATVQELDDDDVAPAPPVRRLISPMATTEPAAPARVATPSPTATTEPAAPARVSAPSLSPMAIQLTDEHPAGLPPVEAPAALEVAEPPAWREEPAPTMPGMEAPEPVRLTIAPALAPVPAAEVTFEDDDEGAPADDDLVDVDIDLLADEDDTGPIWERPAPPTSIQPFTDPHFGVAMQETPAPAPGRARPPGFDPDEDAPRARIGGDPTSLDVDEPSLGRAHPLPWEADVDARLPEPANEPIVRLAPWLATAAMAGLVLLTLVNAVRAW